MYVCNLFLELQQKKCDQNTFLLYLYVVHLFWEACFLGKMLKEAIFFLGFRNLSSMYRKSIKKTTESFLISTTLSLLLYEGF